MANESRPSTPPINESPWRQILASRRLGRAPGRLVPYVGKAALWDPAVVLEPAVDAAAMSATAIISTPHPDRSEDVVEPLGARLENYARNPVVYFDHGFSGITVPIAKSEDHDGNFTVAVSADGVEATSYFAQGICEACQIFDLIQQKIIRGASINMTPIVAKIRSAGIGPRPGLHIEEWELLEWSWVGLPDNPEAVRKILDGGKLAGAPICEPIRKCLIPLAAGAKLLGKGISLSEPEAIARSDSNSNDFPAAGEAPIAPEPVEFDVEPAASAPEGPSIESGEGEECAFPWGASPQWPDLLRGLESVRRAANLKADQRIVLDLLASRLAPIVGKSVRLERGGDVLAIEPSKPAASGESAWAARFDDRLAGIERKLSAAARRLLEAIPHRGDDASAV